MTESAFGFDAPEDSPGFLLWQTTLTWQRAIRRALEPHGVSHAEFVLLAILLWYKEQAEVTNQTLLARQSKLDKMTVSKSLRQLAAAGLVKRSEDKQDPRANAVTLTDKGRKLVSTLVPLVEGVDAKFFGALAPRRRAELAGLLRSVLADSTG
jgi:DNA-binding MarR family transcriptional regulator